MIHSFTRGVHRVFIVCLLGMYVVLLGAQNAPWPVARLMEFSKGADKMPAIIDNAGNNRGACFDGKHVFIASRQNGNHIYYWTLGDSTATPRELDLTGVAGGTFVLSDLAFATDHLFLSNMVFVGGAFKVYAWKDRSAPPALLLEYPMAPARLGDAITVVGDPNTAAKLIASGHGTKNIYIWDIVNGAIPNTQPTIVSLDAVTNVNFARLQQVSDPATPYLVSGPTAGLLLLDSAFQVSVQIPPASFPSWPVSAQVFNFSGKRYLTYVHVRSNPAENARYVVDITEGGSVKEALQSLSQAVFADRLVHQGSLGNISNGNASVGAGLASDAFGNILCMSYAAGNGFITEKYGDKKPASVAPVTTLLDKTQANAKMPASIDNAGNNRGATCNGEHVFVASRQNGNHIYYWDPSAPDADPKELNLTGVAGGTFVLSDIVAARKQIFLCNMVFVGGAFKVYRWKDVQSAPEIVLEFPSAPARLGDAFTVIGNPDEEARIIVSGHGTKKFYIWSMVNGKVENTTPAEVEFPDVTNVNFGRITAVEGEAEYFLASAPSFGLLLLNSAFQAEASLTGAFLPSWPMDAHVFQYKGQRLLGYTHVKSNPAENALYVLDLTDGENVVEAIKNLSTSTHAKKLIHQVNLGTVSNGNASVTTDFVTDQQGSVWALSFAAGNGFVLQRFGENTSAVDVTPVTKESILFPNPSSGEWIVSHPGGVDAVYLRDMQGRVVESWPGQGQEVRCTISDVTPGIYLVQVISNGTMEWHKLMISGLR